MIWRDRARLLPKEKKRERSGWQATHPRARRPTSNRNLSSELVHRRRDRLSSKLGQELFEGLFSRPVCSLNGLIKDSNILRGSSDRPDISPVRRSDLVGHHLCCKDLV